MKTRYRVRRPEFNTEWDNAIELYALDPEDAAETFGENQCANDPERYASYESGVVLEVKCMTTDLVTDVDVSMYSNPTFRATARR